MTKDYKILIDALRCIASEDPECKADCPYRFREEIKPDFPWPADETENGIGYWVSCDCDRIVMDAAEAVESLCRGAVS